MFDSDDSFFDKDQVAGLAKKENEEGPDFEPWHKPRKQWIRDKQWWGSLRRLLSGSNRYNDIGTLKYFGLPGGDLLDIEFIRDCLTKDHNQAGKSLLVHGIVNNKKDQESADSRMSSLLDQPNIHADSKIDRFNFGSLRTENSAGWSRVNAIGPYHFVNLDFCDCIFQNETLESIYRFMDFQLKRHHGIPWLFCITTRVDRGGVNEDLFQKLNNILTQLDQDDVLGRIKECFDEACEIIESKEGFSSEGVNDDVFSELVQICVVLWIVTYSLTHGSKIELTSSMKYRVHEGNEFPDMFSFVFRLEKKDRAAADVTGLVEDNGPVLEISLDRQIQLKVNAISKLSRSMDIDNYFEEKIDVQKEYANQMKALLSNCGWDVDRYMELVCPNLT